MTDDPAHAGAVDRLSRMVERYVNQDSS